MRYIESMKITAPRDQVLATLKENREKHATIVAEAREGYVKAAEKALKKRLAEVREGKVVALTFHMAVPADYTRVYDTAIRMMELHTGSEVELESQQVRSLMMDEWDWRDQFLASNALYSATAASMRPQD